MDKLGNLAVVGSGPTAVFLLKHLVDAAETLRGTLTSVAVIEKGSVAGYGMPYHPETTDVFNLSNISSEEIPELGETLIDWLQAQTDGTLAGWRMDRTRLSSGEVYPRLALGAYLKAQFDRLVERLTEIGIPVKVLAGHRVTDIRKETDGTLTLEREGAEALTYDSVVIATGHTWPAEDEVAHGHYFSPWPIKKLLPEPGTYLQTTVGILGASLSAFDVVSSLAHRHGNFVSTDMGLKYEALPGTEDFALVLHSSEGWLPHLQFDQAEPFREIYRHVDRSGMLALVDDTGFLRLSVYFDQVCRPALRAAFVRDQNEEMAGLLSDPAVGFEEFINRMSGEHRYENAFEGMSAEMMEARISVLHHRPIHWKETIDDLMFTLNFHAELLPAEDQLTFRRVVNPFLMNVIAAMPLPSGRILLALHEAGVLTLEKGKVKVDEAQPVPGRTAVTIENDGITSQASYGMFVECGGQKAMGVDDYPFPSLVSSGVVCDAIAWFADPAAAADAPPGRVVDRGGKQVLLTGGVGIDAAYRVLRSDGTPDPSIFDLAFPHASGTRPYSYGLQACSATGKIMVGAWLESIERGSPVVGDLGAVSDLYEAV